MSPGFIRSFTTVADSTFSPSTGSLISVAMSCLLFLSNHWIGLLGIDIQIVDGLANSFCIQLLIAEQCRQSGKSDETGVNLEEVAQRYASLTPAEAVRTQRMKEAW